jgi:hypothetical protein
LLLSYVQPIEHKELGLLKQGFKAHSPVTIAQYSSSSHSSSSKDLQSCGQPPSTNKLVKSSGGLPPEKKQFSVQSVQVDINFV